MACAPQKTFSRIIERHAGMPRWMIEAVQNKFKYLSLEHAEKKTNSITGAAFGAKMVESALVLGSFIFTRTNPCFAFSGPYGLPLALRLSEGIGSTTRCIIWWPALRFGQLGLAGHTRRACALLPLPSAQAMRVRTACLPSLVFDKPRHAMLPQAL